MAASATFALKAGVWFRRARRCMVSPDSQATACPLSGRNSTYRPVQISGASSEPKIHRFAQRFEMSNEKEPKQFSYDGFASYATDPDRDLVRNVEKFIESLHRDRLIPKVFRDKLALCVD